MASTRIVSTSNVQATNNHEATHQKIDLTPSDVRLLLIGAIQKGLLFPKPDGPSSSQTIQFNQITTLIQQLKTSLSRTLDFFTPLAGRLATTKHEDDTISFFIDCNNNGAQFVHAVADGVTISDILEPVYVPPIVHSFFPLNGIKNSQGVSMPLLAVQITELVDGIFIGCTMNHSVVDGTSFWKFFNSWAEISRSFDQISINITQPILERNSFPIRIPLSCIEGVTDEFILPPFLERVFHFTKDNIALLKAKANCEAKTNKISSLQSLLAHLWRSIIRSTRQLDAEQESHLHVQIGVRSRTSPPLAENYFGNAIVTGVTTLRAREILEEGLGYVALEVNKMIAWHTDENVRSNLEAGIEKPIKGKVPSNSIITSSSPRFNVYGTDFGWGRPIAVRSGLANKFVEKLTLFPGVDEGSVDIEVCVLPEILAAMINDSEFMDVVTV